MVIRLKENKKIKILLGTAIIILSVWWSASAIEDFLNPLKYVSEVAAQPEVYLNRSVQVVGLIQQDSILEENGVVNFKLTDGNATMLVEYRGALPQIKPEVGVTVIGTVVAKDKIRASNVLAKCPSKYQQTLSETYARQSSKR